jgi:hypothetical protein
MRPGYLGCGVPVGTATYVRTQLHARAFGACPVDDACQMALDARADTAPSDCVLGIVVALDDLLLSGPGPPPQACTPPNFDSLVRTRCLQALQTHVSPRLSDASAVLSLPHGQGGRT